MLSPKSATKALMEVFKAPDYRHLQTQPEPSAVKCIRASSPNASAVVIDFHPVRPDNKSIKFSNIRNPYVNTTRD